MRLITLLDPCTIFQHYPTQVACGRCRPDLTSETFRYEPWDQPAMIDMGVSEQHCIDGSRIETEVSVGIFSIPSDHSFSLEHSAIQQNALDIAPAVGDLQ